MSARAPSHGVRFVFEKEGEDEQQIRLRVSLLLEGATHAGVCTVDRASGEVNIELSPEGAPAWALSTARAFVRAEVKAMQGGGVFPRRITRWRAAASS